MEKETAEQMAAKVLADWDEEDDCKKTILLPSQHQIDDSVWLNLWGKSIVSEVHAVHFYTGKVKYDLNVFGENGLQTRIYNVDSVFVTKS